MQLCHLPMDSEWLSMFISFINCKYCSENDFNNIIICVIIVVAVMWTFLFS